MERTITRFSEQKEFKSNLPKYYQIKNLLIKKINSEEYKPDEKLYSVTELMKKFSISNITARRIMNEIVKEGLAYTIPGRGCYVSRLSDKKDELKNGYTDSKRIMLIITGGLDEFFVPVLQGIIDVTQLEGYSLELYHTMHKIQNETQLINKCLKEIIAGLLFVPTSYDLSYKHLIELKKKNMPVILIDRYIKNDGFDYVGCENYEGARKAVNYLTKSGHKNIAYIGYNTAPSTSSFIERLDGYKKALKENRIKYKPELVLYDKKKRYESFNAEFREKIKSLFSRKTNFTAIFTPTAQLAIVAYKILRGMNIRIPEDVSIITFDDTRSTQLFEVPLTTVGMDKYKLGNVAAKILLKRIRERIEGKFNYIKPEKVILKTKINIRKSVKNLKR